jgi:hypothetical protein
MVKMERRTIKISLRNGKVINHRRRIPVGIQVVVSSLEWHRICPDLVQDSRQILRIGSYSGPIFGNGDVSHLQLLPSLFFICLEYLVERLFKGSICPQSDNTTVPSHSRNSTSLTRPYLVFSGDGERTVLQLFGREVRQDVGDISRNIRSGGE